MALPHVGILLNSNFDLSLKVVRDASGLITSGLQIGNTIDQDAAIVLTSQQGDIKEDLLLGACLTKYVRGKYNASQIESRIRLHFTRAGIDYSSYKERMNLTAKTTE